jgi:hypothetical protein
MGLDFSELALGRYYQEGIQGAASGTDFADIPSQEFSLFCIRIQNEKPEPC